jgi:peptide/nickel transport system substrate-binding protein
MKLTHVRWRAAAIIFCMLFLLAVTALSVVNAGSAAAPAAQEVAAPIPYPEPNDIGIGGLTVNRQPISEIVVYKALPEYHQAPMLDPFVESGELPPVEERLPAEPAVYLTSGMKDGIGVYGDVFRGFSACPTAGYNRMAGVSMGWFGIESYTVDYGALVKTGPLFRADQDIEPMPQVAKSWEWSEDGMQLTMHLVEGIKWSDGVPFTADDVMFTWDGYIQDPNVAGPRNADSWSWNGEFATLEKVDDFTIMFTFPVAFPYDAYYLMDDGDFDIMPAHQLKPLHPQWSEADPKPTYAEFKDILPPR